MHRTGQRRSGIALCMLRTTSRQPSLVARGHTPGKAGKIRMELRKMPDCRRSIAQMISHQEKVDGSKGGAKVNKQKNVEGEW